MTAPNHRVDRQADVLRHLAVDITRALEHTQRELAQADVWRSDTMPERVSGTPGSSPVEADRLLAVYDMRARREQLRDWIDVLEAHDKRGQKLIDEILRARLPGSQLFDAADYGTRCKSPACEQWSSPHTIPTANGGTQRIDGWCDEHWLTEACQIHGDHPHDNRKVGALRCCQAAYRKHQRETTKEVA